jgi:hypothetical protein
MLDPDPLYDLSRQLTAMTRQLRRLPAASRAAMDDEARVIGDRIARRIDQAAGAVPRPGGTYARALRRGGIQVKPGRGDLQIVVGGARPSGIGRMSMRQIVWAAEMGGGKRTTSYRQRRRRSTTTVRRATTRQFGRHVAAGRFVYPTWKTEAPAALEAWAAAVDATIDAYWQEVARA